MAISKKLEIIYHNYQPDGIRSIIEGKVFKANVSKDVLADWEEKLFK